MRILVAASLILVLAVPARGQTPIFIGAVGDIGYTVVSPQDWLGNGVFNANQVTYGGGVVAVFGRREGAGLQVGVEGALHRIMTYDVRVGSEIVRGDATALRTLGFIRFWMGENHSWFGEFGVGAFIFDGFKDPTLSPAIGTVFGDGRIRFPVKVRGSLLFDPEAMVFPVVLQTGVQLAVRE